ncbi:hypothetical protein Tco_0649829 [Tanacetum coccineum]
MEPVNVIDDDDEDDDNDQNSMTEVPSGSKAKHFPIIFRGVVARMTRIRSCTLGNEKETINVKDNLSYLVTQEIASTAPQQFEAFLQRYMQNHVLSFQPSSSSTSIHDLQHQLYLKMKDDPQSQAANHDMWNILKEKIEINSAPFDSCKLYDF